MSRIAGLVAGLAMVALWCVGVPGVAYASPAPAPGAQELAPMMLVLDASGSMKGAAGSGGTKMAAAKDAVHAVVDETPDSAELGLTVYGTGTGNSAAEKQEGCRDVTVVHEVGPLDRAAIGSAVDSVKASGYTPIGRSLQVAAKHLPAEGPRSIVLVSDGIDTCAPPEPCEVAKDLAEQGVDLRVHTVGFDVGEQAREQLTCIAQATGGTYHDAPKAGDLGPVLTRVTASALRTYRPAGIPVDGVEKGRVADAPVLKPGQYLDTIGLRDTLYYAVNIPEGYVLWFAATAIYPRGITDWAFATDTTTVRLYAADGEYCEFEGKGKADSPGDAEVATASIVYQPVEPDGSGGCGKPGRYLLEITRGEKDAHNIDDPRPIPYELNVGLEPPVTGDGGPPAENRTVSGVEPEGPTRQVVGGSSFGTAATLPGSGVYTEEVRHGEFIFYRVRLDWGQGLAYGVRFQEGNVESQLMRADVATGLYAPSRVKLRHEEDSYFGEEVELPSDGGPMATALVRYNNRKAGEDNLPVAASSVAGWYYISVKVGRHNAGLTDPTSGSLPVTLYVSVVGEPGPGPDYVDENPAGTFGQNVERRSSQSPGPGSTAARPASQESGISVWWIVAPTVTVVVLGAGALTGQLIYRRRRRA